MAKFWLWKDKSEQFLKTYEVTVNGAEFKSSSYWSGEALPGTPVPGPINGAIAEMTDERVACIRKEVARLAIMPHLQVAGAFIFAEGAGIPLGKYLSLMKLEDAITRGYHHPGSPAPRTSDLMWS